MKRVLVILVAAGLVLNTLYRLEASAQSSTSGRPPIEQPLVSEGEFAVELATALNLTSSKDEAAAEDALDSIGITPRNGWISDYPMTPEIIAEVRESTARSASSGSLSISEADAARPVDNVSIAMNLQIEVAGENTLMIEFKPNTGQAPRPPRRFPNMKRPQVLRYTMTSTDLPVVSYYPPPSNYGYLYAWVPWPFWWEGFGLRAAASS